MCDETQDRNSLSNVPDPNNPLYLPNSIWRFEQDDSTHLHAAALSSTDGVKGAVELLAIHEGDGPYDDPINGHDSGHRFSEPQLPANDTTPGYDYDADIVDEHADAVARTSSGRGCRDDEYARGDDAAGGPTFFGWR